MQLEQLIELEKYPKTFAEFSKACCGKFDWGAGISVIKANTYILKGLLEDFLLSKQIWVDVAPYLDGFNGADFKRWKYSLRSPVDYHKGVGIKCDSPASAFFSGVERVFGILEEK